MGKNLCPTEKIMSVKKLKYKLFTFITLLSILLLILLFTGISYNNKLLFFSSLSLICLVFTASIRIVSELSGIYAKCEYKSEKYESRLQCVMESVYEGIFITDEHGKILDINAFLSEFLGYTKPFMEGKKIMEFIKSTDGNLSGKWFSSLNERPVSRLGMKVFGIKKDGEEIPLQMKMFADKKDKMFKGFLGFVQPVKKDLIIEQIESDILFMLYQNVRDDFEKIMAFSDKVSSDIKDTLDKIRQKILSRISPEQLSNEILEIRREPINYIAIIKELEVWAKPLSRIREQNIVFKYPAVQSIVDIGDAEKIYQALKNIVLNAVKYTHVNGKIEVKFSMKEANIEISVNDNGIGIPQNYLDSIFQPYFASKNTEKKKLAGMGMGLWLADKYVRSHKGYIYVESTLGKGSTFCIHLPRRKQS